VTALAFSEALGGIGARYLEEAADYRAKRTRSLWKRGLAAACLCLVIAGALFLLRGGRRNTLVFNELASFSGTAAQAVGGVTSEPVSAEEAAALLGFDLISAMPEPMRAFDFTCAKLVSGEDGAVTGVVAEGYADPDAFESPGVFLTASFEEMILVFEDEGDAPDLREPAFSAIGGRSALAFRVPSQTYVNARGEEKARPARYYLLLDGGRLTFWIESRGSLTQEEVEALAAGLAGRG
jgi:hypothetical protein